MLNRQPRYRNDENGLIRQKSSMISFTGIGARLLVTMGFEDAKKLKDSIKNWWDEKKGKRERRKVSGDGSWTPEKQADRARFDGLLGIVGEKI